MAKPPCRLFVIPARDAPLAVILRRGPSSWYHVILWHTDTDTFDHGAWFRGRIYEERCDLSPDGELFVYFALQGRKWGTSYAGSWTAVSRPPWLHALALWPHGDTWGGGGYFEGPRAVVIATSDVATHPPHPAIGLAVKTGTRRAVTLVSAAWDGVDHVGRAVFACAGKLFRRVRGGEIELADFNDLTPDPQPAPDWAREPLPRAKSRRRARQRG